MWYRQSADTTEKLKECSQYGAGSNVIVKHLKRSQNIDAQDGSIICNRRKFYFGEKCIYNMKTILTLQFPLPNKLPN